jgi:hypothetical protein
MRDECDVAIRERKASQAPHFWNRAGHAWEVPDTFLPAWSLHCGLDAEKRATQRG